MGGCLVRALALFCAGFARRCRGAPGHSSCQISCLSHRLKSAKFQAKGQQSCPLCGLRPHKGGTNVRCGVAIWRTAGTGVGSW